jgi:hypothetical protein
MPTRILYAVDTSTGQKYRLMTLHSDGSLTAEADDMTAAIPVLRDERGFSNEFIFETTKRRSNAYVRHVEEVVEE